MECHDEVRHPESSNIVTVKDLLEDPHIQWGMMWSTLSMVTSLFTPSKLPSTGDDNPVATNNTPVGSTPNVGTNEVHKELSTYKVRLALELTNFKEQLDSKPYWGWVCETKSKVGVWPWALTSDSDPETINALWHQFDQLGVQLQQQQATNHPLLLQAPPLPDTTLPHQPHLHYYNQQMSPPTGSLVEVMDVLNRSMTNQYAILQETLRQLWSAYKEHYLSSVQSWWQGPTRVLEVARWGLPTSHYLWQGPNGSGTSYFQGELA